MYASTLPHPTAAKTNERYGQACAKDAVVPGQAKAVFAPWVPDDYDLYVLGMQEGIGDNFIHGLEEYLKEFDVEMLPGQGKGGPRIEGRLKQLCIIIHPLPIIINVYRFRGCASRKRPPISSDSIWF